MLHVYQDGTTSGAVSISSATNIEDLAGTDNQWTAVAEVNVGSTPIVGRHHMWIGRSLSTSAPTVSGANSTSEDLFWRFYEFQNVSTGTTLATVIENDTQQYSFAVGSSATINDRAVVTNGPDRLALQLVSVADPNAVDAFTGMTGGTWSEAVAEFTSTTGTDATIQLQTAAMASAGTIDGGSYTMGASAGWGIIGTALIGTTVAASDPSGWLTERRTPRRRTIQRM